MGEQQPTNGPYHWGNGPKPTRKAGGRKPSTHGCFATAAALIGIRWVANFFNRSAK